METKQNQRKQVVNEKLGQKWKAVEAVRWAHEGHCTCLPIHVYTWKISVMKVKQNHVVLNLFNSCVFCFHFLLKILSRGCLCEKMKGMRRCKSTLKCLNIHGRLVSRMQDIRKLPLWPRREGRATGWRQGTCSWFYSLLCRLPVRLGTQKRISKRKHRKGRQSPVVGLDTLR